MHALCGFQSGLVGFAGGLRSKRYLSTRAGSRLATVAQPRSNNTPEKRLAEGEPDSALLCTVEEYNSGFSKQHVLLDILVKRVWGQRHLAKSKDKCKGMDTKKLKWEERRRC